MPSATAKVPISREALRQCEVDARKAERTDEALDAAEKAKRRAARCGGALDAKDQDLVRVRAEKEQMVRRSQTLRIVTYIASGVAVVSTGLVVGDALEVIDL